MRNNETKVSRATRMDVITSVWVQLNKWATTDARKRAECTLRSPALGVYPAHTVGWRTARDSNAKQNLLFTNLLLIGHSKYWLPKKNSSSKYKTHTYTQTDNTACLSMTTTWTF